MTSFPGLRLLLLRRADVPRHADHGPDDQEVRVQEQGQPGFVESGADAILSDMLISNNGPANKNCSKIFLW